MKNTDSNIFCGSVGWKPRVPPNPLPELLVVKVYEPPGNAPKFAPPGKALGPAPAPGAGPPPPLRPSSPTWS